MIPVASYRQIGGHLGAYLRANNPNTQQIQALLSDVLTGDELLLPMRDLVARKCFINLQPFAGSGGGIVQRDACLQELARSYLPIVVDRISQVINGMLDQPDRNTSGAQKSETLSHSARTITSSHQATLSADSAQDKSHDKSAGDHTGTIDDGNISPSQCLPDEQLPHLKTSKRKYPWHRQVKIPGTKGFNQLQRILVIVMIVTGFWRAWAFLLDGTCTYRAAMLAQLTTNSAEFGNMIKDNKLWCMNNTAFREQLYRVNPKSCAGNTGATCLY